MLVAPTSYVLHTRAVWLAVISNPVVVNCLAVDRLGVFSFFLEVFFNARLSHS